MESWCYSLASTFFAEWAAVHQNNSCCCPLCCCPWPLQRNTQEFTILWVWFLHLIKSVQNNTRLKFSPRYRNFFFSCLISKSSKISHDQHFCSTRDEIVQYKKIICSLLPEFAKITPNLRDTISCWQQHYLKFSTLLERAASRHNWHLALQQYFSHPWFLISCFPRPRPIYLWRKVVCFAVMRSNEPECFRLCYWCLGKAVDGGEVHGLGSMMYGLAVQKFLNIEWILHWKLNYIVAENFEGIGMCLWCCWKDLAE